MPTAQSVGYSFEHVTARAAKLAPVGDRRPVVGRLYHAPLRFSYVIRFQVTPTAQDLEHGVRFEPGR